MCGWAQVLEDEDLSDPTSNTAKQFRTDFRLPYPFFSELVNLLKVTPLHQTLPRLGQIRYHFRDLDLLGQIDP